MSFGSGGDGGASQARQQEEQRQNNIRSGTASINNLFDTQFTDEYYKNRRKAYLDFANPQLDDQHADARKKLTYWLDSRGMLDSSGRVQKEAELQKEYDKSKRAVSDQALAYENDARSKVTDARGNLINMLSSTGDTQGAVTAANSRAAALSAPDAYSPIGDLFSGFTSTLGHQAALERADSYGGSGVGRAQIGRYNTGVFGGSRDSVRLLA